jgi:hypothetical protein
MVGVDAETNTETNMAAVAAGDDGSNERRRWR